MRVKFAFILSIFLFHGFLGFSQTEEQMEYQKRMEKSFDVGFIIGVTSFQTDYGQRYDIKSTLTGNTGLGLEVAYYMNFFHRDIKWYTRTTWFADHIKLKGELSYYRANLEHHLDNASVDLLAMHGTSSVINLGIAIEYHFLDLTRFTILDDRLLSPYIAIGGMVDYSDPTFETSLGDYLSDPSVLHWKYVENAIFVDPEFVGSITAALGTRIKSGADSDIVVEARWQYFSSNNIDALDPKHYSNKYNDWMFFFNVGYVHYLD